MGKIKKKFYLVISEGNKYTYGAFKFSPEGLKEAEKYAKKIKKEVGEKLIILEK